MKPMHIFEKVLSVSAEDIEFTLRDAKYLPWADFLLNPRRLRGSDFLMRWSQGAWSEERMPQAMKVTGKHFALSYGQSGTVTENGVRALELYFDCLEEAGLGRRKC